MFTNLIMTTAASRRRLSAAERRKAILDATMSLFARHGSAGVRTRDLARAAGVSEAMVFKLFPDKDALYRALLERKIAETERELPLAQLAASEDSPEVFFGRIAGTILRRIEEDPSFMRLLLYSALEGHPLAQEFDRARAEGVRSVIVSYLRRCAARRRLRRVNAAVAARCFVGIVIWFAMSRSLFREKGSLSIPRDRLVREVVRLFLDGVRRS